MLSACCLSVLSCPVCNVGILWPNGWTDQDEAWHAGRPWPWLHCVRFRHRAPSPKGHSPQFLAHICCGQMARWIKMVLGRKISLYPSDIVLDGEPAPLPKKGTECFPQFSAHVYCSQTAEWLKMPLCVEVGLDPSDIVLDGDPAPPKRVQSPQFLAHACCGQTAAWITMPLGMEIGLGPGHIVRCGDPDPPP